VLADLDLNFLLECGAFDETSMDRAREQARQELATQAAGPGSAAMLGQHPTGSAGPGSAAMLGGAVLQRLPQLNQLGQLGQHQLGQLGQPMLAPPLVGQPHQRYPPTSAIPTSAMPTSAIPTSAIPTSVMPTSGAVYSTGLHNYVGVLHSSPRGDNPSPWRYKGAAEQVGIQHSHIGSSHIGSAHPASPQFAVPESSIVVVQPLQSPTLPLDPHHAAAHPSPRPSKHAVGARSRARGRPSAPGAASPTTVHVVNEEKPKPEPTFLEDTPILGDLSEYEKWLSGALALSANELLQCAPGAKRKRPLTDLGAPCDIETEDPTDGTGECPEREKNRLAAKRFRERRETYVSALEAKALELENENRYLASLEEQLTIRNRTVATLVDRQPEAGGEHVVTNIVATPVKV